MKYLIILLLFLSSCKKEQYTAENCPVGKVYYYYYDYKTSVKCCGKYISPCDSKTIQEFVDNCPDNMEVGY